MSLERGNELNEKKLSGSDAESLYKLLKEQQEETRLLREQLASVQGGITSKHLTDIVRAVRDGDKEEIGTSDRIRPEQIPTEDYDEKGTIFCSPSVGYLVVDDVRKGFPVKLPYNMKYVFFEFSGNNQFYDQNGKKAITNISTFRSHSKKLTEWLKAHTLFNVDFYASGSSIASIDVDKARRRMVINKVVGDWDPIRIMRECKNRNLVVNQDVDLMKAELVNAMIDDEFKAKLEVTAKIANETRKDELLLRSSS